MHNMKFLNLKGLQHFYDKYIRPLKGAAYKDVANDLITTEEGSVLDARQGKALEDKKVDKSNIINSLLATVAGYALDARQGKILDERISEINTYLAELLPKTINASALALLSHWQVMAADVWKEADTVHINMEIYTDAVIQANQLYTINTPASTDPDVRPAKLSFLSAFATDAAYGNTVAVTGIVTPAGEIQISIPNASRPYVFITGEYRTAN